LAEIRNISAFAYGVARKMCLEIYASLKRHIPIEDTSGASIPDKRNVEFETLEKIDRHRRLECVRWCLEKLPSQERALFIRFETADSDIRREQRKRLAANAEISSGALRVRIFRIKKDLAHCARKCLSNRKKQSG
jgi:DNA-directed RNA polymerase specialized sigma24 family protein